MRKKISEGEKTNTSEEINLGGSLVGILGLNVLHNHPYATGKLNEKNHDIPFSDKKLEAIVIEKQEIRVLFDYPFFETEITFTFRADSVKGFTRKHLIDLIREKYFQLYCVETLVKGDVYQEGGIFGKWLHDISSLWITGISRKSENLYELLMDS